MKTLFAVTVFVAGIYLFIQQEGLEKLKQYLPQNNIEQSAEKLLANVNQSVNKNVNQHVDEKLEQFKNVLLTEKDTRIDALEKKLLALQSQFNKQVSQQANIEHKKIAQEKAKQIKQSEPTPIHFPAEPVFAKTQYLAGESSAADLSFTSNSIINIEEANTPKQKAIKRQANLQDIAARMNKTSLLALSH